MTPALKAMVEAMAAECLRQNPNTGMVNDGELTSTMGEAIWVDLEAVARAGLEAIRKAGAPYAAESAISPTPYEAERHRAACARDWAATIDAILKEQP